MKAVRMLATLSLVILIMVTMIKAVPAQAQGGARVIEITATSFKFEPSVINVTEGEKVVIRLRNNDTVRRFPHDISSRYFASIPLTVRAGTEGAGEGRKYVRVPVGQTAEFEFTAANPGSYAFICQVFTHSFEGMAGQIFVKRAQ